MATVLRFGVRLAARPPQQLFPSAGHASRGLLTTAMAFRPLLPTAAARPRAPSLAALGGRSRVLQHHPAAARRLGTASANNAAGAAGGAEATGPLRFVPLPLRQFTLKYGFNFIAIYMSVYWLSLVGIYSLISAGVMPARDMMGCVEWGVSKVGNVLGIPLVDWLHLNEINPEAAPLVAAWMLAKPTEPLRLLASIGITPVISRQIARVVAARGSTPVDGKRALRCASLPLHWCPFATCTAVLCGSLLRLTVAACDRRMLIPFICTSLAIETVVLAAVARKDPTESSSASAKEETQSGRTQQL